MPTVQKNRSCVQHSGEAAAVYQLPVYTKAIKLSSSAYRMQKAAGILHHDLMCSNFPLLFL